MKIKVSLTEATSSREDLPREGGGDLVLAVGPVGGALADEDGGGIFPCRSSSIKSSVRNIGPTVHQISGFKRTRREEINIPSNALAEGSVPRNHSTGCGIPPLDIFSS